MRRRTYSIVMVLALCMAFLSVGSAVADVLVISPDSVTVPVRGHVQFEAQLFNNMAMPRMMDRHVSWQVIPEDLGKITDDGFFMAGDKPGVGMVVATLKGMNQEYRAVAKIQVGPEDRIFQDFPKIEVKPAKVALNTGDSLKFRAIIRFPSTSQVVPNVLIRWIVKPFSLGRIKQNGVFYASNLPGAGKVIAYAEYMGKRISGEAYVVVGKRAKAQISGRVFDAGTDQAIADAVVIAQRIGAIHWVRRARSDQNGNYSIKNLIPGYYVIRADKREYVTEFYDNVHFFQEATPLQVADRDTIENIDFAMDHGAAIAGTVYSDPDSSKLADAHVFAYLKLKPEKRYHTLTDDSGRYVIPGLLTGAYVVAANKDGYKGEFFDNVQLENEATLVSVTEPDTTGNIDFALGMRSAISGTVVSDVGGVPIEGAVIMAKPLNATSWMMAKRARTDENGNYILQLPAGYYIVHAAADSFNGEYYDNTYDPALASPVQVIEDEHTSGIRFSLAPLSTITGVVTDQNNDMPLVNASVWAFPEVGPSQPIRTRTDENGRFVLTRLHPGIYFVKANAENYYPEFYQEAATLKDATPVTVGYNETKENIDFTLLPASKIRGVVLDDQGNVLPERALVVAKKQDGGFERTAITNENGEYVLEGIRKGTYYVFAIARGYQREFYDNATTLHDATPVEVGESEEKTGIDFSLSPVPASEGAITGLVVSDDDTLPIPGAFVAAIPAKGGKPYFGITGSEGKYELTGMASGNYYVIAYASGYIGEFYNDVRNWKKATLVTVVSPDVTEGIDFSLARQAIGPYVLRGRIQVRTTQQPVANAMVFAFRHHQVVGFGITDEQGNYSMLGLPAGQYQIYATAPGFVQDNDGNTSTSDSVSVDLSSGQEPPSANITMEFETATGVSEDGLNIPQQFSLEQNYPNPFNPETEIRFQLPESGLVTLSIYNVLGQTVKVLVDGEKTAGDYSVRWNGLDQNKQVVPSGIYFYRIQVKNKQGIVFDQVRKMTLMR